MKATFLFLIFFVLIAPQSRALLTGWMGDAGNWMVAWAPVSYVLLAVVIAAPIAAIGLMVKWPKPAEPENPMSKYKHEDVME